MCINIYINIVLAAC